MDVTASQWFDRRSMSEQGLPIGDKGARAVAEILIGGLKAQGKEFYWLDLSDTGMTDAGAAPLLAFLARWPRYDYDSKRRLGRKVDTGEDRNYIDFQVRPRLLFLEGLRPCARGLQALAPV